MKGFVGTIVSGVVLVAGVYVALKYNAGLNKITNAATSGYGKVVNNAMQGPGVG
jgi:hypothetical protein